MASAVRAALSITPNSPNSSCSRKISTTMRLPLSPSVLMRTMPFRIRYAFDPSSPRWKANSSSLRWRGDVIASARSSRSGSTPSNEGAARMRVRTESLIVMSASCRLAVPCGVAQDRAHLERAQPRIGAEQARDQRAHRGRGEAGARHVRVAVREPGGGHVLAQRHQLDSAAVVEAIAERRIELLGIDADAGAELGGEAVVGDRHVALGRDDDLALVPGALAQRHQLACILRRAGEAHVDHRETFAHGDLQALHQILPAAGVAAAQHADVGDARVGRDAGDDAGHTRPVAELVVLRACRQLDFLRADALVGIEAPGAEDACGQVGMGGIDAAVDDGDVHRRQGPRLQRLDRAAERLRQKRHAARGGTGARARRSMRSSTATASFSASGRAWPRWAAISTIRCSRGSAGAAIAPVSSRASRRSWSITTPAMTAKPPYSRPWSVPNRLPGSKLTQVSTPSSSSPARIGAAITASGSWPTFCDCFTSR